MAGWLLGATESYNHVGLTWENLNYLRIGAYSPVEAILWCVTSFLYTPSQGNPPALWTLVDLERQWAALVEMGFVPVDGGITAGPRTITTTTNRVLHTMS